MLTTRQKKIVKLLYEHEGNFIKGVQLSHMLECSIKTLQNDIKELKNVLSKYHIDIQSATGKGYQLIIHNEKDFKSFEKELVEKENYEDFNNQSNRITYILSQLLLKDTYIKSDQLADEMYVSRSSISSDIKIVKKILEKYQLSIDHKPNYGMKVIGTERQKRDCITKERLTRNLKNDSIKNEWISIVSDIVVETLMQTKYRISDVVLQNLVLHIWVSIQRMKDGIYIENQQSLNKYAHEKMIAKIILDKLSSIYHFETKESEVDFLALHLLGKRSYEEQDIISSEIDRFVNDMLEYIKLKTDIDFIGDLELKISLALHLNPLFIRLENQMQLQNSMTKDIQSNYPLAYDIAVIGAAYIQQQKNYSLSDDEIGYLAVHFSLSLVKKENKVNPKKVLVICNARRGDYLMIQHTFLKEFNEMISDLHIANANEISQLQVDSYDCVFTTFLNHPLIPKRALRINFFIDQKDRQRIRRALLGQNASSDILNYFQKDYFMENVNATTKEEIIHQMCNLANHYIDFDTDLYSACMRREQLGSTAYGHLIALPHPDSLISQKTIVVTAILKKPIIWSGQKVQLVFLICVEKGNQKDLRTLFEWISKLMIDQKNVEDIIQNSHYDTFMKYLKTLIG